MLRKRLIRFLPALLILIVVALAALCLTGRMPFVHVATLPYPPPLQPQPDVWEMPSVTCVPTSQDARAMNADPHVRLIVDRQVYNPNDEPIGRPDTYVPSLVTPPSPAQADADRHWWTQTGPARDRVEVSSSDSQTLTIDLSNAGGGWLVVQTPYDSNWQASLVWHMRPRDPTVSLLNTPILRANGKFEAIFVPPRVTRVVFRYDPPIWRYALFAGMGGMAMVGLLLGIALMPDSMHGGCHDGMALAQRSNAPPR
jgi:hypothetical protein